MTARPCRPPSLRMNHAPRSISIEGPLRSPAKRNEVWYKAHCRCPLGDGRGYGNLTLVLRVRPGSRFADWLKRRLPMMQAIIIGDVVHIPSDQRITPRLLEHEAMHAWQYLVRCRGSVLWYMAGYFLLLAKYGYHRHPWEREAYGLHASTT